MSGASNSSQVGGAGLIQPSILRKWQEVLTGLKDNGRMVTVRSAAMEYPPSHVIEVEDHIVILDTPANSVPVRSAYTDHLTLPTHGRRHFVALDAIVGISRDLTTEEEVGAES